MPNNQEPDDADTTPRDAANAPVVPAQQPENGTSVKSKRKAIMLLHSATLGEWYDALIAELATLPGLYVRGGSLVTVDPVTAAIVPVNKAHLAELITGVCEIWEQRGERLTPISIPRPAVLQGILQRRMYPGMRELREVLPHPMMLADGTVLHEPGYHDGLYLPNHGLRLHVKDLPSRADAVRALDVCKDLVAQFPFRKRMHLAAWLSVLLAAVTSAAHEGNLPPTVIDADRRGTGKTWLVHIISIILTGEEAEIHEWKEGEQLGHLIFAAALAGKRLFLIDDVAVEVRGQRLNAASTSRRLSDRGLGTKNILGVRHCLQTVITGNHLAVASDMTRRVIGVRLKSPVERPELRSDWKYPKILQHVREHRAELMSAALTIVRAYHCAGRPPVKVTPLGSFEEWSDWVCRPLVWLGLPNPIDTQDEIEAGGSSDSAKLEAVVMAWLASIGEDPITTAELRDALRARSGEGKYRTLRDTLKHAEIPFDNAVKLGLALRKLIGRKTKEGWEIAPAGKTRGNAMQWAVRRSE
ncbi:MAG TPA: hypothetical protein VFN67_33805 [Polyangiales bacterium]|nr:hypothetical protein [Polyangiales bacterium]